MQLPHIKLRLTKIQIRGRMAANNFGFSCLLATQFHTGSVCSPMMHYTAKCQTLLVFFKQGQRSLLKCKSFERQFAVFNARENAVSALSHYFPVKEVTLKRKSLSLFTRFWVLPAHPAVNCITAGGH